MEAGGLTGRLLLLSATTTADKRARSTLSATLTALTSTATETSLFLITSATTSVTCPADALTSPPNPTTLTGK